MNSQVTLIGAQTHIKGNLQGDEDLNVVGRVDGTISLTKSLIVEPTGVVVAEVKVQQAVISGTVIGNITADDLVHITAEGRVVGDIAAPRLVLVDGASFRGNVDMGDLDAQRVVPTPPVAVAPVRSKPSFTSAPATPLPRPSEPLRAAPPRPAPPPKRVLPVESKPLRLPRKPEPERRVEVDDHSAPERKPEPARKPEPERRSTPERRPSVEPLDRRAEAAAQAVASRTAAPRAPAVAWPKPQPAEPSSSSEPPRPPTTAGKKSKAKRR